MLDGNSPFMGHEGFNVTKAVGSSEALIILKEELHYLI